MMACEPAFNNRTMEATTPMAPDLRTEALEYGARFLGKAYRWGGDDPLVGFDCSGLMVEMLKATGRLPRDGDWSAAELANRFPVTAVLKPGVLVFWNRGGAIGHVEMVWAVHDDTVVTIGASGGGSGTTSDEAAIKANAFVKLRPITPGWARAVDPFAGQP